MLVLLVNLSTSASVQYDIFWTRTMEIYVGILTTMDDFIDVKMPSGFVFPVT